MQNIKIIEFLLPIFRMMRVDSKEAGITSMAEVEDQAMVGTEEEGMTLDTMIDLVHEMIDGKGTVHKANPVVVTEEVDTEEITKEIGEDTESSRLWHLDGKLENQISSKVNTLRFIKAILILTNHFEVEKECA